MYELISRKWLCCTVDDGPIASKHDRSEDRRLLSENDQKAAPKPSEESTSRKAVSSRSIDATSSLHSSDNSDRKSRVSELLPNPSELGLENGGPGSHEPSVASASRSKNTIATNPPLDSSPALISPHISLEGPALARANSGVDSNNSHVSASHSKLPTLDDSTMYPDPPLPQFTPVPEQYLCTECGHDNSCAPSLSHCAQCSAEIPEKLMVRHCFHTFC